jgi:TPR repeat protein
MRKYAKLLLADQSVDVAAGRGWMQKAAAAGDVEARIAAIDTTGPNSLDLLSTIERSGKACSVDERVTLARAYAEVTGLPGNPGQQAAVSQLRLASLVVGGDASKLSKLATAYRDGIAGPTHVADAEAYFQRAADLGEVSAVRELAQGHLDRLWADSSPATAKTLLLGLFKGGDASAGNKLIRAIADQKVPATGDDLLALMNGNVSLGKSGQSYLKLVKLDETGTFGAPHPDLQARWLEQSAETGNPGAMVRLYRAYSAGVGVAPAPDKAMFWLQKAAQIGDTQAVRELAAAYEVGFGVPLDPARAETLRDSLTTIR